MGSINMVVISRPLVPVIQPGRDLSLRALYRQHPGRFLQNDMNRL